MFSRANSIIVTHILGLSPSAATENAERPASRNSESVPRDGFLFRGGFQLLPGPHGLSYFLSSFDVNLFRVDLFDQYGVELPTAIRGSVVKRQAEFLAGRVCARQALHAHEHGTKQIGSGTHRNPIWPPDIVGSITHTTCFAAAAVASGMAWAGLGIDIESIVSDELRVVLESQVASVQEIEILQIHMGSLSANFLLTLLFSAKESFFKAAFAQVNDYFDFDAVRLFAIDPARRRLQFRCVRSLSSTLPSGTTFDAYFDCIGEHALLSAVMLGPKYPACKTVIDGTKVIF